MNNDKIDSNGRIIIITPDILTPKLQNNIKTPIDKYNTFKP